MGRKVDAKGARLVNLVTAVPMEDLGNDARSYLTPLDVPVLMNRRIAALTVLWVVYHLPLLWRRRAAGWMGCRGREFRMRTGCNSPLRGRLISATRALISVEVFLKACLEAISKHQFSKESIFINLPKHPHGYRGQQPRSRCHNCKTRSTHDICKDMLKFKSGGEGQGDSYAAHSPLCTATRAT